MFIAKTRKYSIQFMKKENKYSILEKNNVKLLQLRLPDCKYHLFKNHKNIQIYVFFFCDSNTPNYFV